MPEWCGVAHIAYMCTILYTVVVMVVAVLADRARRSIEVRSSLKLLEAFGCRAGPASGRARTCARLFFGAVDSIRASNVDMVE